MVAVTSNDVAAVEGLLEQNTDSIDVRDARDGDTGLIVAAFEGFEQIVDLLVDAKAQLDVQNHEGDTALILAATQGHKSIVRMLISSRANVDVDNKLGNTALIQAAKNSHTSIVTMLMEGKANLNHRNKNGHDVAHFAKSTRSSEIVEALTRAHSGGVARQSSKAVSIAPMGVWVREVTSSDTANKLKSDASVQLLRERRRSRKLQDQLTEVKTLSRSTEDQVERFRRALRRKSQTYQLLEAKLEGAKAKLNAQVRASGELRAALETVQARANVVSARHQDTEAKLRLQTRRVQGLLQDYKISADRNQKLEGKIDALQQSNTILQKQVDAALLECKRIHEKANGLRSELKCATIQLNASVSKEVFTSAVLLTLRNGCKMTKHCRVDGSRNKSHDVLLWLGRAGHRLYWDSSMMKKRETKYVPKQSYAHLHKIYTYKAQHLTCI